MNDENNINNFEPQNNVNQHPNQQQVQQPIQQPNQQLFQQPVQGQFQNNQPPTQSGSSGLGIAALILSILGCTFLIGLILAIIDLTNKDGKNKTISKIALGICGVWLLLSAINIFTKKDNKNDDKTAKGSDIITTEVSSEAEEKVVPDTEETEDENQPVSHESVKNDFNAETAGDGCDIGGYNIKIPYYYIIQQSDKDTVKEYNILEKDQVAKVLFIFYENGEEYTDKNRFFSDKLGKFLYGGEVKDINIADMNALEYKGYYKDKEDDPENGEFEGDVIVIYDEVNNHNMIATLIQKSDSKYDYTEDFKKSLETIAFTGVTKTEGEIDQDFKEFMDSYEAFVDEYVDFMKKMNDDPSDLTLLSELTDYMTRLTDFNTKLAKLDNDELNDAELAYYIEVTTRCSEKMLKAGISN